MRALFPASSRLFVAVTILFLLAFSGIGAAASVSAGAVTLGIPDYQNSTGWQPGVVYDANATVNFTDTSGTNKQITITLPEGMRFVTYPVKGTPAAGTPEYQMTAGGALSQFTTSVTSPPKQTFYPSYNGALTYTFTPGCEAIDVPFKLTVDENVYYGPKVITDGVRVEALKDGISVGDARMNVNAVGAASFSTYSGTWVNPTGALNGSAAPVPLPNMYIIRGGILYPKAFFTKETQAYYYYPREVRVIAVNDPGALVENNTADGYLRFRWNNQFLSSGGAHQPSISVQATLPGTYTAISRIRYELTMYDGTKLNITSGYLPVQVSVLTSAANKLDLAGSNVLYYKYAENYFISGPRFRITNGQLGTKERQYVEYTIDPGYEVIQVVFPRDRTLGVIGEVQYNTSLNPAVRIAAPAQVTVINTGYGPAFAISRESLGLSAGEYITYARASIGGVSKGYTSQSIVSPNYLDTAARIIGKLKDGTNSASVTIRTFALLANGSVEAGSVSSTTNSVTRVANPTPSLVAKSSPVTMAAGQTRTMSFSLEGAGYYYSDSVGQINPAAYIRVPENTIVGLNTIRATDNYDGDLPITVTGPYTSARSGETFVKVAIAGKTGSFFDLVSHRVTLTYNLTAGKTAGGSYNWKDYVFWRDDISNNYVATNGYPAAVLDTLDVDNDGDVAEKLLPANTNNFLITPSKEVIIDTYIVPAGGTRKQPYDGSAATAIRFTPGTTANYTVDILNNRGDSVQEILAYIPVPKEGNNFSTEFQTNPYYWNMKLSGVPTVRVYDASGTDITATAGAKYVLTYSSDATNAGNYAAATYSNTISDSVSMIRMHNSNTIPAGENATISFAYIVNETPATLAASPAKLGSTNDFRPHYYFRGSVTGWSSGTPVGAQLWVGQIAGYVFFDGDHDGIYSAATDTRIAGKTVRLYEKNASGTYVLLNSTTTAADGTYNFNDLGNGVYRLDFDSVVTAGQVFTLKDQGTDDDLDSDVNYVDPGKGIVEDIDPTADVSRHISAGIIADNPAADFTGSPVSGTAPLPVRFKDTSTCTPTVWNWSFGDGSYSTLENPVHTYASTGSFTVILNATNTTASSYLTKTGYISVFAVPTIVPPSPTLTPTPSSTPDSGGSDTSGGNLAQPAVKGESSTMIAGPAGNVQRVPDQKIPAQLAPLDTPPPVPSQTLSVTPPESPDTGFPFATIALIGAGCVVLAGAGWYVRRWWIRRQNPALFEEY